VHDLTNPLIPSAYSVWGDPNEPAVFDAIAAYSPYENLHPAPYPAALAIGGILDNRVGYWESAKWIARLRELSTSGRPALLRINMTAGHQGHAGLLPEMTQAAFLRAFAVWAAQPPQAWAPA
jgi:oligopeptidase B